MLPSTLDSTADMTPRSTEGTEGVGNMDASVGNGGSDGSGISDNTLLITLLITLMSVGSVGKLARALDIILGSRLPTSGPEMDGAGGTDRSGRPVVIVGICNPDNIPLTRSSITLGFGVGTSAPDVSVGKPLRIFERMLGNIPAALGVEKFGISVTGTPVGRDKVGGIWMLDSTSPMTSCIKLGLTMICTGTSEIAVSEGASARFDSTFSTTCGTSEDGTAVGNRVKMSPNKELIETVGTGPPSPRSDTALPIKSPTGFVAARLVGKTGGAAGIVWSPNPSVLIRPSRAPGKEVPVGTNRAFVRPAAFDSGEAIADAKGPSTSFAISERTLLGSELSGAKLLPSSERTPLTTPPRTFGFKLVIGSSVLLI